MTATPNPVLPLLAFAPAPARAYLGATADECTKLYGRPCDAATTFQIRPPARIEHRYKWRGFHIETLFVGRDVTDSRCASVSYEKGLNFKPDGPSKDLTVDEIDTLLSLNANGSSWERVPGGWKRKDNRAFAREFKAAVTGHPFSELRVFTADFDPKAAAEIAADHGPTLTR